jgi:histidyl-tRNA synthetase
MKFELEFFEEFVTKECRKNTKLNSSISDYQKQVDVIEAESERIKKCFVRHLFEAKNDRKMEQFIQQHQAHIIRLADKVATIIDKETVHNLKKTLHLAHLA